MAKRLSSRLAWEGTGELDKPAYSILSYESKHAGKETVGEHYHEDHQMLYVLEGEGIVQINKHNHKVMPDKAVFLVPYSKHAIFTEHKLTLLVLEFDKALFDETMWEALEANGLRHSTVFELNPFEANEMRMLLRKILYEQSSRHPLYETAKIIYLQQILLIMSRNSQEPKLTDSNRLRAERIRQYIGEHYFEKLSAEDISVRIQLTPRYVNDIFKTQYGITPTQFLTQVRIEAAQKMLVETRKDIVTIAFEVGYETLSTFYRNFKEITNVTPSEYRTFNK